MDKVICYFSQRGTVFSDDKLDRAKKLKLPYIYVKSDKIVEYGNFPNGWILLEGFNLMDVRGIEKKVGHPKKIFTIIQFKDWLDYMSSWSRLFMSFYSNSDIP